MPRNRSAASRDAFEECAPIRLLGAFTRGPLGGEKEHSLALLATGRPGRGSARFAVRSPSELRVSRHRDHAFRSIVITRIAIVVT